VGVSGQFYTPEASLLPGKIYTRNTGGWVGPRVGLDGWGEQKISWTHRGSNPEPSSRFPKYLPTLNPFWSKCYRQKKTKHILCWTLSRKNELTRSCLLFWLVNSLWCGIYCAFNQILKCALVSDFCFFLLPLPFLFFFFFFCLFCQSFLSADRKTSVDIFWGLSELFLSPSYTVRIFRLTILEPQYWT